MPNCCDHPEEEHHLDDTCEEVIHYPSEDYPCMCNGFVGIEEETMCVQCGHIRQHHVRVRVCRPAGGGFCSCRTVVAA